MRRTGIRRIRLRVRTPCEVVVVDGLASQLGFADARVEGHLTEPSRRRGDAQPDPAGTPNQTGTAPLYAVMAGGQGPGDVLDRGCLGCLAVSTMRRNNTSESLRPCRLERAARA